MFECLSLCALRSDWTWKGKNGDSCVGGSLALSVLTHGAVCNWVCWCVAGVVNDFLFFFFSMNLVKAGFGSCHMKSSMWVEAVVGAVISQRQLFRQPIPSLG